MSARKSFGKSPPMDASLMFGGTGPASRSSGATLGPCSASRPRNSCLSFAYVRDSVM